MKRKLVALAVAAALGGLAQAQAGTIAFTEVDVPTGVQKRLVQASPETTVDGTRYEIGFNTILRSGDELVGHGSEVYGQIIDQDGNPILAEDGSSFISNDNDFASLLPTKSGLFMVSHFESRPGAMYLTELKQERNGELTPTRTRPLDFSKVKGGWVHCAGSVTPWGTHLGSEEYEPDAKQWRDGTIDDYNSAMVRYFGITPEFANPDDEEEVTNQGDVGAFMNPYDYGYPVEVAVKKFNQASVTKHYAMGRMALELAYVMPDQKTVYMSDDGTNVGLYRFVADRAGDLSAGTLYIAKWEQKSADGLGEATLSWIDLGHATDKDVKEWIGRYRFEGLFTETDPVGDVCPAGFTSINAGHEDGDHQCLKLVDGVNPVIASRLETRRYAAMMGGTTEFRKMEGITFDADRNQLYLSLSEVDRGMLDFSRVGKSGRYTKYDQGGWNDMTLAKGNVCGGVYALSFDDQDDQYMATSMAGLVAGIPMTTDYGADEDSPNYDGQNKCDLDGIANPDNLTYMPGYNTLIIGEDTGDGHQNDAIWAYNLNDKELTRIETTPYGSETTSPYFYPNINGYAYLMSVVQHPYGESDEDKLEGVIGRARAYTGYIGPFPAMDGSNDQGRGRGHKGRGHNK